MPQEKQKVLLLAGPSFSGKTSIIKAAVEERPDLFERFTTNTCRKKRPNEKDGEDYHFNEFAEFADLIRKNKLFEHNSFLGNGKYYGCSYAELDKFKESGKIPIAAVDLEGAKKFMGLTTAGFIDLSRVEPYVFFISVEKNELVRRLVADNDEGRRKDTPWEIIDRIVTIKKEVQDESLFDPQFIVKNPKGNFLFTVYDFMSKSKGLFPQFI